jgi:plasmid maintenance system antidote protein VapI
VKVRGQRRKIQSAYIRERLRQECAVRGVATKIAEAIGFSGPHITNVQKNERGVGEDLAEALAAYWGFTPDAFRAETERWAKENPDKLGRATSSSLAMASPGDPYPKRALAADLARDAGIAEEPIQSVLHEDVPPDRAGWPALWWANRMQRRELELMESRGQQRQEQLSPTTPPAVAKGPATRRKTASK